MAYAYNRVGDGFELRIPHYDTVGASSLLTTVEDLADGTRISTVGRSAAPRSRLRWKSRANSMTERNSITLQAWRSTTIAD